MTDHRTDPLLYIYSQLGRIEAQIKALEDNKVNRLEMALLDVKVKDDRASDMRDLHERIRDKINKLNSQLLKNSAGDEAAAKNAVDLAQQLASLSTAINNRFAREDEAAEKAIEAALERKQKRMALAKMLFFRSMVLSGIIYAIATEGQSAIRHVPKWFATLSGWFGI